MQSEIGETEQRVYDDFLIVLGEGKALFPLKDDNQRTIDQINSLIAWIKKFESVKRRVEVFGSEAVNEIIDKQIYDSSFEDLDEPIKQFESRGIKLEQSQLNIAKLFYSKDHYNDFLKKITEAMQRDVRKPISRH